MNDELNGRRVAILTSNEGVEQVELTAPLEALRAAGAEVDLIAPNSAEIQAFNHLDAFCARMVEEFAEGRHASQTA
jgi:protease I